MFKLLLILLVVAGLHARPLQRLPNGRLKQTVQDEHVHNSVLKDNGVKPKKQLPVPAEFCRQGTEPSRRFLMDMNTRMLKHEAGKRVSGLDEFRQGTENHLHILQELRARHMMKSPHGSQNDKHEQREIPAEVYRQGTEPSRSDLMDLNTGLLKEHRNEMDRRVSGSAKWEVVSEHEESHIVPVELRRQGTEPSRRFLIDMNTGMPKEEISEMNRRVSGFYNPPAVEKRQGTEPSRRFLMDMNTGMLKEEISEMNRRVSGFYNPPAVEKRQGTEPSRRFLMDMNTGMLKEEISEMNRRVSGFYNPPAVEKRQGTEPSRRFLIDMNTGMLKEEISEMNRRVSGFYNPPAYEMRQGTQDSRAALVDPRTGQLLPTLTELQRSTAPLDEFRQGTEHQPHVLQELRLNAIQDHIAKIMGRKFV